MPDDLWAAVKERAAEVDRYPADVIRQAVKFYLRIHTKGDNPAATFTRAEDFEAFHEG